MATVCCVLKSGGEYKPEHVHALRDMISTHLPLKPFVCFTDTPEDVDCQTVTLDHDLEGKWSKLEVFGYHGPVIYLDLDSIVISDLRWLAEIAHQRPFTMLRDMFRGHQNPFARQTSAMTWAGDMSWILRLFLGSQEAYQNKFRQGYDQEYLESIARAEALQDLAPDQICFFNSEKKPTVKTSLVIFKGHPRPWDQQEIQYKAAAPLK